MKGSDIMSNYFAIERNGETKVPVVLGTNNGNVAFENFLSMTYNEMKSNEHLGEFVDAAMIAADRMFGTDGDQTIVILIGEDGNFIWSVLMSCEDGDNIRYALTDWKKDGKNYRYAD